jgi:DNA-directed RNA polymerase sigma subunit (sigma70/sigma32)
VDRELEFRIGVRIDAALDRIRSKACRMGMAGKWHVGKALDILQNADLLERDVGLLGEHEEARYLDNLPNLIAAVEEQDRRCAECWDGHKGAEQESNLKQRGELVRLFLCFQFHPKLYERLVRQPDKQFLRNAIRLLDEAKEMTREATELEGILRMNLRDFVLLEKELVDDLRDLDNARGELCAAHQELAISIANSQPHSDGSTVSSALVGLRRAATFYDHKRCFDFAEYAQHWIQEAIDKRRM